MAYQSDILLGRIIKVNGVEGAVTVRLEKVFFENIPQMESVFLEIEGRLVPFFINSSEYTGANILKLKFAGYNSIEKVGEFIGCLIFLTGAISDGYHTSGIPDFNNYKVLTQDNKLLGTITEVIPSPGQWLLNILSAGNKDVLIPFHDHFIVSIDKKKKIIVMDLPEGLTEIN